MHRPRSSSPTTMPNTPLLGMSAKIALAMALLTLFTSGILALVTYRVTTGNALQATRNRLRDIVALGALQVDAEVHARLRLPDQQTSPAYETIHRTLQRIRDNAGNVRFVYTMRSGPDERIRFVVDAESDPLETAALGEIYDGASPLLKRRFKDLDAPLVESETYTDRWGTWLTGYAPIYTDDGVRVGVLAADINAATLSAIRTQARNSAIGLFGLFFIVTTMAGWILGRILASPLQRLTEAVRHIGEGHFDEVNVQARDETGILAANFNVMAARLQETLDSLHREIRVRGEAESALREHRERLEEMVARRSEELRRAYGEMQDSERLHKSLIETIQEGVCILQDGIFRFANPAAEEMFGVDSGALVGRLITDFFPEEHKAELLERYGRRIAGEAGAPNRTTPILRMDGQTVLLAINSAVIRHDGRPALLVTARDMTEDILRQEQLSKAKENAERADRAKTDFLSTMSHELRTPLNVLLGTAEVLRASAAAPEQRRLLDMSLDAGRDLQALVEDMLDLSALDAGRLRLRRVPFSPSAMLAEVLEAIRSDAERKGLELHVPDLKDSDTGTDADGRQNGLPPRLLGDAQRLSQILTILLENAVKFTDAGSVSLAVECFPAGSGLAGLRFLVSDTGPGIPPHRQADIFDHFVQLDPSSTRRHEGAGLGLHLGLRLTELMGGSLRICSQPGEGTTMCLTLTPPLANDSAETPTSTVVGPMRVLLADDSDNNRYLMRRYLEETGWSLAEAVDGTEAVRLFRQRPFDLVLMDVRMPTMDGLTATRLIREMEQRRMDRPATIIAVSANAAPSDRRASAAAGCDAHLEKPLGRRELLAALAELRPNTASPPASQPTGKIADEAASVSRASVADVPDDPTSDPEIMAMIPDFLRYLLESCDGILAALDRNDLETATLVAHRIKGEAGSFGLEGIGEMARTAERAGRDGLPDKTAAAVREMRRLAEARLNT